MIISKKKSKDYITSLNSSTLNNKIYFEDIKHIMFGKDNQKFSIKTKKHILYLLSICFPLTMLISLINNSHINSPTIIAMVGELIIIFLMSKNSFLPFKNYFKYWNYEICSYTNIKLAYLSIFVMGYGMDEGSYIINFIVVSICIILFLYLYQKVEENMILKEINSRFNENIKTSKLLTLLLKLTGILVVLLFILTQLYRMNKWWLDGYLESNLNNNNAFIDNLIGIFIGIPILLLITLIPTYFLFNSKDYIIYKLVSKDPESFRERYDYSKKEWYE